MSKRPAPRHHHLAFTQRLGRSSERGAALVIALAFLVVFGLVLTALLAYAGTSVSTNRTYLKVRRERYAGDNAIRAAINWTKDQPKLARDPNLSLNDPKCIDHVPSEVGMVTVSCQADPGGGSGRPSQGGLVPDYAITALGAEQNEAPNQNNNSYNNSRCGNDFFNFFSPETPTPQSEKSILLQFNSISQPNGTSGFLCSTRQRPTGTFTVNGNVRAAGRIQGSPGFSLATDANHNIQAQYGCGTNIPNCAAPPQPVTDPGNGGNDPAWQHVPIDWNNVRTVPYYWDGTQLRPYAPTDTCATRGGIIIFQPGWYKDVNVLNRFTGSAACSDRTIWFAPSAGPDGQLQTSDDVTGAYYFGFRNADNDPKASSCNTTQVEARQWCIGGSATSTPRVVAGGAKIGSDSGAFNPLATGSSGASIVNINSASTVDSGLSQTWRQASGAKTIGDGDVAYYEPSVCLPFGWGCFSLDRSIRVRDFGPKVVVGPDRVGANAGPINLSIAHQEAGNNLSPSIEVKAVGPDSGTKASCGTFGLTARTSMTTDSLDPTQASALGACLSSADLINGMQVTYKVTGNGLNSGSPVVKLDGVKASYSATSTTAFPASVATTGTAAVDCDPEGAGAQFIFGGDSHVYVADGNLQVCAGTFPTSPEDHQQIGIWQPPAVAPIEPTSVAAQPSTSGSATQLSSGNWWKMIGEPAGAWAGTLSRSVNCDNSGITCLKIFGAVIGGGGTNEANADLQFPAYTPPAGMAVESVQVRATYTNAPAIDFGALGNVGANAQFEVQGCPSRLDFGRTPDSNQLRTRSIDATSCLLSSAGTGSFLSNGFTGTWHARRTAICLFGACGGNVNEKLDGVELLVNLKPADDNQQVVIPASGCIRGLPNYWAGLGAPDCAVLKADSTVPNAPIPILQTDESKWFGRFSIQGTVYAPSGALEIDDSDAAYPSVTRGMVVRHLRVTGYAKRSGYSGASVDLAIKKSTSPREATYVACLQSSARAGGTYECDTSKGDRVLTRARVRFELDPATTNSPTIQPVANIPQLQWWSNNR